jgi:hypothetical protein
MVEPDDSRATVLLVVTCRDGWFVGGPHPRSRFGAGVASALVVRPVPGRRADEPNDACHGDPHLKRAAALGKARVRRRASSTGGVAGLASRGW